MGHGQRQDQPGAYKVGGDEQALAVEAVDQHAREGAEQQRGLDTGGIRMPIEDSYIAATARRHGLTIVTGNDRHFRRPGLKVFNPFKERE